MKSQKVIRDNVVSRGLEIRIRQALISASILLASASTTAAPESAETINVIIGQQCACGSHIGTCDASWHERKIELSFGFNSSDANPVARPIKVMKSGMEVDNWASLLCPFPPGSSAALGSTARVTGTWQDRQHFRAIKIEITE